jgi:hypothetical protein
VNPNRRNFDDIKQDYYWDRTAPKATKLLKKWGKKDLLHLLRHHKTGHIEDEETWQRDFFDFLLGYYSMLEIALLIRFINDIPRADADQAVEELSHVAVRRYYEINYELPLPRRLRLRLTTGRGELVDDGPGATIGIFMEFMTLTTFLETDEDLEVFLWFLDGGSRGKKSYSYQDTLKVLESAELLGSSMSKPEKKRTILDHSVDGFMKFLNFCVQLDDILLASKEWPRFQQAMYECHAYWFVRLRKTMQKRLAQALKAFGEVDTENEEAAENMRRIQGALDRLLSGRYDAKA